MSNGVLKNGSNSSLAANSLQSQDSYIDNNSNANDSSSESACQSPTPSTIIASPSPISKQNTRGQLIINGDPYIVSDCVISFLKILAEYCNLCSMLPSVTIDIGLKAAELIKFFNSRICQLLIGAGAINISGLKTITIRNLALASRSIQLVRHIVPYVLLHFDACYSENSQHPSVKAVNGASPGLTKAESRQFETLQKQFDKAAVQMKDHVDELSSKIVTVVWGIMKSYIGTWQPSKQIPSSNFKALCKQLNKLHESTNDIWNHNDTETLFIRVHGAFLDLVRNEIRIRNIHFDSAKARVLQSEMTFYGQCLLRLNILPISELSRERFEALWKDEFE